MEQRLEEVPNKEENRRPEVGAAKDAEAWRPAEIADKAEVWTPDEAVAKAGGCRPAKSAGRREVAAETDCSCGAEVAAGAGARVIGRPASGVPHPTLSRTSSVVVPPRSLSSRYHCCLVRQGGR